MEIILIFVMFMISQRSNTKFLRMKKKLVIFFLMESKKKYNLWPKLFFFLVIWQGTMSLLCLVKILQLFVANWLENEYSISLYMNKAWGGGGRPGNFEFGTTQRGRWLGCRCSRFEEDLYII